MPSETYIRTLEEVKAAHRRGNVYSGKFLRPHKPYIRAIVEEEGISSILDFGCGRGDQYRWRDPADGQTLEESWGVPVTRYDPGVPEYAAEPTGRFGLVLCTHVLGSVPIVDLPWFLERLMGYASSTVYIAERLGGVKKNIIPNPELHPINWTAAQWRTVLLPYCSGLRVVLMTREKSDLGTVWTRSETFGVQWHTWRVA